MKAIIDAESDRLLGANILRIRGDEFIHRCNVCKRALSRYKKYSACTPTVAKLIPTMLQDSFMLN
jgi:hypothetical protein